MPKDSGIPETLPDHLPNEPEHAIPIEVKEIVPDLWVVITASGFLKLATPEQIEEARMAKFRSKLINKNRS